MTTASGTIEWEITPSQTETDLYDLFCDGQHVARIVYWYGQEGRYDLWLIREEHEYERAGRKSTLESAKACLERLTGPYPESIQLEERLGSIRSREMDGRIYLDRDDVATFMRGESSRMESDSPQGFPDLAAIRLAVFLLGDKLATIGSTSQD